MWLFLASEILFFGGLIVAWMFCRHWQLAGFDAGARETVLWIGTLNLFLLITSSFVYSSGLAFIEAGNIRRLIQCCVVTMAIGTLFLLLKFYEWHIDISEAPVPVRPVQDRRPRRRRRQDVLVVLLRRHRAACRPHDRRRRPRRLDRAAGPARRVLPTVG